MTEIDLSENTARINAEKGKLSAREAIVQVKAFYTPETLAREIMNNPPTVKSGEAPDTTEITPHFKPTAPSEQELEAADAIQQTDMEVPEDLESFYTGAKGQLLRFIRAPQMQDGLTDHMKERQEWRRNVQNFLDTLDKTDDAGDPITGENKGEFLSSFYDLYNNNKLTTKAHFMLATSLNELSHCMFMSDPDGAERVGILSRVADEYAKGDQPEQEQTRLMVEAYQRGDKEEAQRIRESIKETKIPNTSPHLVHQLTQIALEAATHLGWIPPDGWEPDYSDETREKIQKYTVAISPNSDV